MTSAKPQKEKPHVAASSPRLTPRPTAASAARAARNATNRTLIAPTVQRQSPSRPAPPSPSLKKKSSMFHKTPSRAESRTEIKDKPECESELLDSPSTQILVDRSDEHEEGGQVQPENEQDYNNDVLPTEENHRNTNDLADNVGKSYTGYQGVAHTEKTLQSHHIEEEGSLIGRTSPFTRQKSTSSASQEETTAVKKRRKKLRKSATRSANTPAVSRPQTPKSTSSRPMTPVARLLSRPGTPVCASMAKRHGTPASRPSTPVASPPTRVLPASSTRPNTFPTTTPGRPPTPTKPRPVASTPASQLPSSAQHLDEGDIKATFSAKQRQFQRMKKELDLKQQAVLEVFDSMRVLRERMASEGQPGSGEGAPLQELVVFNVADWTADEVAQLCRDAVTASCSEGAIDFIESIPEENAINDWDSKILNIPAQFAELCLQAFSARQELIDWIKELVTSNQVDTYGEEPLERIAHYNAKGLELCEALRELKSRSDDAVDAVSNVSKRVCRDQNTLIAVGKALVREVASLRQDLDARSAIINEMRQMRAAADSNAAFEETRRELEEEKAARLATKDKLATTECQLRQTRMRVSKMDRQLREAEASISSLTGTVKILEDQSRQREVQLEARARKLKESLKTGEMASGQLALQRDALQAEVTDLKNEIEKMTASHKAAISDLNTRLIEITTALEEQRSVTQKEIDLKNYADAALAESRDTIEQMKAKITELENSKHNPELPTEREMDLWAELQATKETLRITEDEVIVCKREKTRFLETLTKIAESDCKVGMQQKLAAELLNKEEILGKMQVQIRELTKNIKLNEQKVIQYEQYVRDLQAHNRAVSNNSETPNCISYQELQQQIMSLRMGLLEAVHRNEELSELLVQKEQQLEQQDKTSRAQARVIKVREELINMLKNKETEQSRELAALQQDLEHRMKIVDEVNKQIAAKAEEIQELFSTLESKQQQIHRLEKIVLALEEQQRRAQAQRTRHEEKIAALEHELAGGGRRERKFLFF